MNSGVKIEGLNELRVKLLRIPEAIRNEALKSIMVNAAQPIVAAAQANAPVLTGELRASIGTLKPKIKDGTISIQIVPGSGFFVGDQYYAGFIEFGHFLGKRGLAGRKFIPPHPFMRPAADAHGMDAVNFIVDGIRHIVRGVLS